MDLLFSGDATLGGVDDRERNHVCREFGGFVRSGRERQGAK
jgi:hypothetical protein